MEPVLVKSRIIAELISSVNLSGTYTERGPELSSTTQLETPLGTTHTTWELSLSEKQAPVDYRSFNAKLQQSVNFNLTYTITT